ncbi:proteasome-associated protein ECM29 homolog [Glossina fuscipes fuscipes]
MATMDRPTFQAIRSYSPTESTIAFVSPRRQTRLTALDLISLDTYEEVLDYLRLCLWDSAGAVCVPGDVKYLNKLKRYIISNYEGSDNNELYQYVQFVKRSVEAKRCESNLLCLHNLLNAAPELLASSLL